MDASDFTESGFTTGTCDAMCPDPEIEERVTSKLVHKFEKVEGNPRDTSLLIKRHYRIVDTGNNAPNFFRTRLGISKTMDRLREIMDDESSAFSVRASFLQDRYKGIWKDMHVQNWKDEFRVLVLEEIARFMILADFLSCETSDSSNDAESSIFADRYDVELGIQLLNQVLVTLMELYDELRSNGRPCRNECEFRGYQIILQATPVQGRPAHPLEVHRIVKACPDDILEDLQDIMELQVAFALKDSQRFFNAFKCLRFFSMALAGRMLPSIREHALKSMIRALNPKARPMPMVDLCDLLMLHEQGALSLCQAYGLTTEKTASGSYTAGIKGLTKLKKDSIKKPPRFGCDIPDWGVLLEGYPKSKFVAQIPIEFVPSLPTMDYQLGMLAYPTYGVAISEWKTLQEENKMSEGEAIDEYQDACLETTWRNVNHQVVQTQPPSPVIEEASRQELPFSQFPEQMQPQVFEKPPLLQPTVTMPAASEPIAPLPTPVEGAFPGPKQPEVYISSPRHGVGVGVPAPPPAPVVAPSAPFQFSAQAPAQPPPVEDHQIEAEPALERQDTAEGIQQPTPVAVPEPAPQAISPKPSEQEEAQISDGDASNEDSDATVIDLEEKARQEDEAIEREKELEAAKIREEAAKAVTHYRNQVLEFLRTIPEGFRVVLSYLGDMWNPSTPFKVPPIEPEAFPVNFSTSDFLEGVKKHPLCQPMSIPDAVFRRIWKRNWGASFEMMFKLIVLGPYTFGEPLCTSLSSYWVLNRLSLKRVGAGKDPEVNQMLDKGPVLLNEWTTKFSKRQQKHVSMQNLIWQPEPHRLNDNDSYLLRESSGILAIIDDGDDIKAGLQRIKQLVKVMPKNMVMFPKLVVMSGCTRQGVSVDIVTEVERLLDSEGFVRRPKVEVIEMVPHLTKLHGELYEEFQSRWVDHFRKRGCDVMWPKKVRENWPPKRDPVMEAIVTIAEGAPYQRRKVYEILDEAKERAVKARADALKQQAKAEQEEEAAKLAQLKEAEREAERNEQIRKRSRVLGSVWKRKAELDDLMAAAKRRRTSKEGGEGVVERKGNAAGGLMEEKKNAGMPPLEVGCRAFLDDRMLRLPLAEKCAYLRDRKEKFIEGLMANRHQVCGVGNGRERVPTV